MDLLSLEDLKKAWKASAADRDQLWSEDGSRRWNRSRGPISAMALSLKRISWHTEDGETLTDDKGVSRKAQDHSPGMWAKFLKESVQRLHERELSAKIGAANLEGRRGCMDVVRRNYRSSKLTGEQKNLVAVASTNALWTKKRAERCGYVVEDLSCGLCGLEVDTLHHRLWKCSHTSAVVQRRAHATQKVIDAAIKAGPRSALYNRGIMQHPCEDYPEAQKDTMVTLVRHGKRVEAHEFTLEGNVHLDGTCDQRQILDLKRAAWAVVQVNDNGEVESAAFGPVPACLPQTSQAGEYAALAAAEHLKTGKCNLFGDCQNVVKDWHKKSHRLDNCRKIYHGLVDESRQSEAKGSIDQFEWVKAHELGTVKARGDADEIRKAVGNDWADKGADEGNKMHPQPSESQAKEVEEQLERRRRRAW